MNENLNLVDILKNCPKGMALDCTMYDNATFGGIIENGLYPIKVYVGDGPTMMLTKYGQYTDVDLAKCIIFPKGETTWEGFVPPCEFKDGDILSYQCKGFNNRSIYIYRYHKRFNTSYYVALSGDDNEFRIDNTGKWALNGYNDTARFATEEERQKLFKAIKDNGYEWDDETKTLKKLVKPKFDPKTLVAFDKVLVKDDGDWIWRVDIISVPAYYNDNIPYLIGDNDFDWIIPYNEETKHLVGTHDEAPEYYRYWED